MESLARQIERDKKKLAAFCEKDVPRANAQALNRVNTQIKKQIVDRVSKAKQLPKKIIRNRIYQNRASPKRGYATIRAYIDDVGARWAIKGGIGLQHEKNMAAARQYNSALAQMHSVPARKRSAWGWKEGRYRAKYLEFAGKTYKTAFIARAPGNGQLMVWRRKSKKRTDIEILKIPIRRRVRRIAPIISQRVMASQYEPEMHRQLTNKLKKYQ